MRFRTLHLIGFTILILLTFLFFSRQSLASTLTISILYALVVIIQLILSLLEDEFSSVHIAMTSILFLSLGYLFVHLMGPSTITTFFLGGVFILAYLCTMFLIFVADWRQYHVFDRMIEAMQDKKEHARKQKGAKQEQKKRRSEQKSDSLSVEEPPHFRVRKDDDGEWIELKVKKTQNKKSSKKGKKTSSKKSSSKRT